MPTPLAVLPKMDLVFKALMENNRPLLQGLLKGVLPHLPDSEFEDIQIINPARTIRDINEKASILDLKLKTKKCKLINVDMQRDAKLYFKNRSIYNLCDMAVSQVAKGDGNYLMEDAIVILICDFVLEPGLLDYHNEVGLYYGNGFLFSDRLRIDVLELPKIPTVSDGTTLWEYLKLFKSETKEDFEMLETSDLPGIKTALTDLERLAADEEFREKLRQRDQDVWTRNTEKLLARQEGKMDSIKATIRITANLGVARDVVAQQLQQEFGITVSEAKEYVTQYYNT